MAEKKHFSHDHALTLVQGKEDEEDSNSYRSFLRCYGCIHKITEGVPYYRCEEGCAFFCLHQACFEMPMTIPDFHRLCGGYIALTKYIRPDQKCSICSYEWYRLAYVCSECDGVVDFRCALETQLESLHSFHEHPVHPIFTRSTDLLCWACGIIITKEDEDPCFGCNYCDFIVHPHCTPVPLSVQSPSHPHQLLLRPVNASVTCRICIQVIERGRQWAYCCVECQYFTHVYDYATIRYKELQHIGHEHPLLLVEEEEEATDTNIVQSIARECHGCRQNIFGCPYYVCTYCKSYHLHKICAGLPSQIKHQMHPNCTLNQYAGLKGTCAVCEAECNGFVYCCSSCNFGVDILCALKAIKWEKEFHPRHPLVLSHTKPSFKCHACDKDTEGVSYQCNTCQFWAHEQCASLPVVKGTSSHEHKHNLNLIYSIPEKFHGESVYCQICAKYMKHHNWAYYCEQCRYFTHVYDCSDPHRKENEATINATAIVIQLPLPDESILDTKATNRATKEHHRHPMIIFADQAKLNAIDLTPAFINLVRGSSTWPTFHVDGKDYSGPTFSFFNGKLVMEITSVDLPHYIKHEAHPHVLQSTFMNTMTWCNACEKSFFGCGFRCTACAFTLDTYCALLPRRLKHVYDKHPFPLTYSAIDGVEEYVCEICEEDVIPKWFYHCEDCDQSIHARCIWQAYIKFERFYRFHLHSCNLTLVSASNDLPPCVICEEQETFGHGFAFLCKDCEFLVHLTCTFENEVKVSIGSC